MKKLIRLVVGIIIPAVVLSVGMANSAFAQKTSDMNAVKAANEAFYTALSTRDVGAMMKVWSTKSDIRHIGPRNKEVDVGPEAIKNNIQAIFDAFPELKVTADNVHVRISGSTAWVTDIENAQRKNKAGESSSGANFGTSIFEKQGGKWLMVYHHASPVAK